MLYLSLFRFKMHLSSSTLFYLSDIILQWLRTLRIALNLVTFLGLKFTYQDPGRFLTDPVCASSLFVSDWLCAFKSSSDGARFAALGMTSNAKTELNPADLTLEDVFDKLADNELSTVRSWIEAAGTSAVVGRVNSVSYDKQGLLHVACAFNQPKTVEMLLKLKANAELAEASGLVPLMIAANEGATECVSLLLAAGANVNARNRDSSATIGEGMSIPLFVSGGRTALHFACDRGNRECAQLLLEQKNIDRAAMDNDGCTPLDLALLSNHLETARLLDENAVIVSAVAP